VRWLCPGLFAFSLLACGGLRTGSSGSGGGSGGGAVDHGCMRSRTDEVHVPVPASPDAFAGIRAMAFTPEGVLVVLNQPDGESTSWITVLGPAPSHPVLTTFGRGDLRFATDLVLDGAGLLYVLEAQTQTDDCRVSAYTMVGSLQRRWTVPSSARLFGLGITAKGELVLTGEGMHRYTPDGGFVASFGASAEFPRQAVNDGRGKLWVPDMGSNAVRVYDGTTFSQLALLGGKGTGQGRFDGDNADPVVVWGPSRLALDAKGDLYANDPYVSRIQKLGPTGGFLGEFGFGGSREVGAIAIEPKSGHVYVSRSSAIDVLCPL